MPLERYSDLTVFCSRRHNNLGDFDW